MVRIQLCSAWSVFLLFLSCPGVAQDNPHESVELVPASMKSDETKTVSHEFTTKKSEKQNNKVTGNCLVEPGNGNLVTSPCTGVVLALVSNKGENLTTRTEQDGRFEFIVEANQRNKLQVAAKFYQLISPTNFVKPGDEIEVQLRQK